MQLSDFLSPNKIQCGDTFCMFPTENCNWNIAELPKCAKSGPNDFFISNFESVLKQFCQNRTDVFIETEYAIDPWYLYISLAFNVIFVTVLVIFTIILCRRYIKKRKGDSTIENIDIQEVTEQNNATWGEKTSNLLIKSERHKLLPSTNHHTYDMDSVTCNCCPVIPPTEPKTI